MIEFLSNNWQLLTTLAGVTVCLYKQVIATRKGVRALLRADLNTMMISDIVRCM